MPLHDSPHPLAGHEVPIASGHYAGAIFRVEDWFDRVAGRSWQDSDGNPVALKYAIRGSVDRLPIDDDVVYGKIGWHAELIHVSELGEAPGQAGQS